MQERTPANASTLEGDVKHLDILAGSDGVVLRDCGVQKPTISALLQHYATAGVRDSWGPLRESGGVLESDYDYF